MIGVLVTVVTVAAFLSAAAVLVGTGRALLAVRVLLDLLTAAGVIRLAGGRSWDALAAAVTIIVLRQLIWAALSERRSGRQSPPRCGEDDHHLPLAVRGEPGDSGRMTT
ncbi:hypothetical protein [Micromonospora costi]|uniref:hypothetical protein n=1 Tax=Micromonospora costi TaxID=1530042 RepID=UPI001652817D|nr:hypothetical protein [Micromonospora costi]